MGESNNIDMPNQSIVNTTGEENVEHDYAHKLSDDCLSDKVMAEIARRLQSNVAFNDGGQVVYAPDPPNSKERIWVETNSTGGIIGTVKRYNTATSEWVDDHYHPDGDGATPFDNAVLNRVVQSYNPESVQNVGTNYLSLLGSTYNYIPRSADSLIEYRITFNVEDTVGGGTSPECAGNMYVAVDGSAQLLSTKSFIFGSDSFSGFGMVNYSHVMDSWGETPGFLELYIQSTSNFTPFKAHSVGGGAPTQANITITEYAKS